MEHWNRIGGPSVKEVLMQTTFGQWLKFELFLLEDDTFGCDFFAYDAAGGYRSETLDPVLEQYIDWVRKEERNVIEKYDV